MSGDEWIVGEGRKMVMAGAADDNFVVMRLRFGFLSMSPVSCIEDAWWGCRCDSSSILVRRGDGG